MKHCGEGRRFPRELPAQSRLPQLCVQPHGLFILLHTPMHNSLTSQCWQKAAQEIVFICALHLPSAKSFWLRYQACLSERDLDKAPATTCMQKSTTPEPWEAGTPPRAGCIPTGSLCCSCQTAAGTSSRRHTRQTARAKGCWWDPRKAKVVSEERKNGDTLSPFFLSAISHSGKVSQESCLVTRKFNFEQDSNFTTFFFT